MAAPKGNKYALGCTTSGRPPLDKISIGKEFIKWATNNPEALTVPMFAVTKGLHSGILRAWAKDSEEFAALFIEGKEQIGINRLKATLSETKNKLDPSIYRAHIGNYDQDIKAEMREDKEFESSLRQKEEGSKSANISIGVHPDLAAGTNISTQIISNKANPSSK